MRALASVEQEPFGACVERGGDERRCGHAAREFLSNCAARCIAERPEPPIATCQDRCRQGARDRFEECVSSGNEERACRERVSIALNRCLDQCDEPGEGDDESDDDANGDAEDVSEPRCTDRCGQHARAQYRRCVANGGEQRACRDRAHRLYTMCVDRCEDTDDNAEDDEPVDAPVAGDADAPDCETRCGLSGRAAFARCIETNTPRDVCLARAQALVDACRNRCEAEVEPAPDRCESTCHAIARRAHSACVEDGGGDERCELTARAALRECAQRCVQGQRQADGEGRDDAQAREAAHQAPRQR